MNKRPVTTAQLAAELGVAACIVRRYIAPGRLPAADQAGGMWLIPVGATILDGRRGPRMRGRQHDIPARQIKREDNKP